MLHPLKPESMALDIFDFHTHVAGAAHPLSPLLCDVRALKASLDEQGISARAVSTPPEFLGGETHARANDRIAETVHSDPRLVGLATVDAYGGDAGARELERAVQELGLRGVFVESAREDLLPDAAEAEPTFAAAASLGVPVFLHPVPDRALKTRFAKCGRMSERLTRGAVNSAAVFAMIESAMFERHAGLNVVVTALALGGLLLGGPVPKGVHIDTTGHHPVMLRASLELLGPGRVVAGTDWPVVQEKALAQRLDAMLGSFGLDAEDRQRVAGDNARAYEQDTIDLLETGMKAVAIATHGWSCAVTGKGSSKWAVGEDPSAPSPRNVLQQTGSGSFPWCLTPGTPCAWTFPARTSPMGASHERR